jgi:hypothetical protein
VLFCLSCESRNLFNNYRDKQRETETGSAEISVCSYVFHSFLLDARLRGDAKGGGDDKGSGGLFDGIIAGFMPLSLDPSPRKRGEGKGADVLFSPVFCVVNFLDPRVRGDAIRGGERENG